MAISEKIKGMFLGVQQGAKTGLLGLATMLLRVITGLVLGLTIALIAQEMSGFGSLSLVFVTILIGVGFFRLSVGWSLVKILTFDLICVLVGQLLKMYILLAP
ncbi:MAG: hypothetical protein N2578_01065 [Bdellovibrionaceae bacterium]|nr:hypothetical protein [Pseudobdellovibrionaceae bacterium]